MQTPADDASSRRSWIKTAASLAAGTGLSLAAPPLRAGASGGQDFDFLHGPWNVRHRKLRRRLVGDTQWDEFPGSLLVRPLPGGMGNIDENVLHAPEGRYEASSLRLFDAATGHWSIYWIDARQPRIETPVVGRFVQGLGSFYSDDHFNGQPIHVRFTYQSLTSQAARWTQAFAPRPPGEAGVFSHPSRDTPDDIPWETNWVMDFTRPGAPA